MMSALPVATMPIAEMGNIDVIKCPSMLCPFEDEASHVFMEQSCAPLGMDAGDSI
jgi:hypothetical protein